MTEPSRTHDQDIVFDNVSKFYGEVLGVNRVHLTIPPGITSLVGPNGSGKTTIMNLVTGLLHPSQGSVTILGLRPDQSTNTICWFSPMSGIASMGVCCRAQKPQPMTSRNSPITRNLFRREYSIMRSIIGPLG